MREDFAATALAASLVAFIVTGWAHAQSPTRLWVTGKEANADSNRTLIVNEDDRGYFDAFRMNEIQTLKPDVISRDEFMLYCDGSLERPSAGARNKREISAR